MPDSSKRLSEGVSVWLTDQIVHGQLKPGQWISENEIARQLEVSRSPVREALRLLAQEGLVEILPRRGTVVADLDAEEADHLYRARVLIESEVVRLISEAATGGDIEELTDILRAMRDSTEDVRRFFDVSTRLHEKMYQLCPNPVLGELARHLQRRASRFRRLLVRFPGQTKLSLRSQEQLVGLLEKGEGEAAVLLTQDLINQARLALLQELFIELNDEPSLKLLKPVRKGFRSAGAKA